MQSEPSPPRTRRGYRPNKKKTTIRGRKSQIRTRDFHTSGTDIESNTETFSTPDTVFRPRKNLRRTPTDKSQHALPLIQVNYPTPISSFISSEISDSQELNNTIMATSDDNIDFNLQEPAYWISQIAQNLITPEKGQDEIAEYYEELNKRNLQRVRQEKIEAVQLQQDLANRREENIRKLAEEEKQKLEEEIRRERDIRRRRKAELFNNTYMEIKTPENPNRQKTLSNQNIRERNLELKELNDIKNEETEEMLKRVSKELEEIKIRMHINSTPKNNNKEKELRDHDHIQPPSDLPRTYQRQQQPGLQQEEPLHEDNPTTTYPTPNIAYNQIPPNERYQPKAQQIKAWGIIFPDGKLDAEDFIRKVDNKFLAENIHKNVALGIIREMLTGYVLDWFDNSRRKWRDWDQFKEIFQDTFSIYQDDTDRQRAIYEQTRRPNETYVQFAIRIQSAYEKIRNPPNERSQVSHVIKTSPMEVGSYLSPEAKYTWNQLIKELNIVDQKRENKPYLRYSNEKTTARGKPFIKQAKIENSDSGNSTMNEENELDNNSEEEEGNLKIQLMKPNNKMKNKPYKKFNEEKHRPMTEKDLETVVKAIQAGTATDTSSIPTDPMVTALNNLSITVKEMLQCMKELKSSNSTPLTNNNNHFTCYRCNQKGHSKKCPNPLSDYTQNNNTNSKNE